MNPPFPQPLRGVGSQTQSQPHPHDQEHHPQPVQPEPVSTTFSAAIRETAMLGFALVLYLFVRNLIRNKADIAYANADRTIAFERWLGVFWEPSLQSWALNHDWLITGVNWVYVWTYWPTLAGTMIWLFLRHRSALPLYRNALLLSGAIGLIVFATFPLSPPRFLSGYGFVDTVAVGSTAYATLYPSSVANWYAAMPSLHVGWTLLMGIALVRHSRHSLVRGIGFGLPFAMFAATVLTANHFLVDGIVGACVALVGLMLARMLNGRFDRRQFMRSF